MRRRPRDLQDGEAPGHASDQRKKTLHQERQDALRREAFRLHTTLASLASELQMTRDIIKSVQLISVE
jgi:hypothetical protein